ncbi:MULTISPECIES: hypothetical protein [Sphingomonadales]|jgi:hypothetical protein|uniref:Lipoprotein n=2 Tax=Sphingomonadaceae TaxID=41297 RepID=A0A397PAR9_9SPHN|nr:MULTISPECIES: hypothetical protein [Sphingomonadaceae]EKU73306.1 hypothetical protein HMPREF9718_03775 [Sphingobium yanoikuyae ATCC 51230]RIA46058.1 hypothetical protein DFR49_0587 [Hephaestia caeni]WQE08087.1 hypothetical protein U0025_04160 [Sphingobium yanoikuyae]
MKKIAFGTAALGMMLSGCANGLPGLRPLTYQQPADTRLIVSYAPCPHLSKQGKNFAPIVAAVLLGAATKTLENFGTALQKGSEGGNLPASNASVNFELYSGDLPQCLIAIRGKFEATEKLKTKIAMPAVDPVTVNGTAVPSILVRDVNGSKVTGVLPDVYELAHYVEIAISPSHNQTALTFTPAYTWIAKSMDGGTSGSRGLSIAVKFSRPGGQDTGSAVLIEDRTIGKQQTYQPLSDGRFPHEASWFATIGTNSGTGGAVGRANTQADAAPAAQPGSGTGQATGQAPAVAPQAPTLAPPKPAAGAPMLNEPFPFTATVTVVESRPTKEFVAFVAGVFAAARPAIDARLKEEIDPATQLASQKTALDNEGAYGDALAKAKVALLNYCALDAASKISDRISQSGATRQLQAAANKAALTADYSPPFTTLAIVSDGVPKTVNPDTCQ